MPDQTVSFFQTLPQELRDRIYREHYECAAIVVRWVPQSGSLEELRLTFDPLPSLNLELVSHKICRDARRIRNTWWPRILTITRSVEGGLDSARLDIVFDYLVKGAARYAWLRQRVEEVIAENVLYRYGLGESCFTWSVLLHSMPRLCRFTFSTWTNLLIKDKNEARRFLVSLDQGAQDDHTLETVHRFGIGDLPALLRQSARPGWSVLLTTTIYFKSTDESVWYRRILQIDFGTMRTTLRETVVEDVDLLSDLSDDGDGEATQPESSLPVQPEAD